ncbi:MAG: DUF106 domain-containing protein [Halobacteriota archaeon]
MARIEEKVRYLVSEDSGMREAVETVLERSDDGTIRWVDVREDLTSGQWGRLIEKGVLVDGEDGFVLADVEATRAGLTNGEASDSKTKSTSSDSDDEGTRWTKWDKGAALVSVALFLGYSWRPMRDLIGGVMDTFLGPVSEMLPFYAVVMILAVATGLYSTLLQANLMDMEKMGEYQDRMKEIQKRRNEAKENDDEDALKEIQDEQMEAMGDQMGMFKEQFRPMVWIMFFTIPVFLWMYWKVGIGDPSAGSFGAPIVLPLAGEVHWKDGIIGPLQVWILWYFLCSMGFTQIIRKGLDIDMTPSSASS